MHAALAPLAELASQHRVAVVVVSHLTKAGLRGAQGSGTLKPPFVVQPLNRRYIRPSRSERFGTGAKGDGEEEGDRRVVSDFSLIDAIESGLVKIPHTYATLVRSRFGLEAAKVVLGQANAKVTEVYAERDFAKAVEVASVIG